MTDLLSALGHGAVYAVAGGALVVLAYYVLDLLTPGHLGTHLLGTPATGTTGAGTTGAGTTGADRGASFSAAVVTAAWLIGVAGVVFTAIWTNGESSLGTALLWTVAFGLLGIVLNSVMLVAIDAVTPGNLREIVTTPGPAVPLAYVAASTALAVSAVVAASIA
jgi:hypothetical protein